MTKILKRHFYFWKCYFYGSKWYVDLTLG